MNDQELLENYYSACVCYYRDQNSNTYPSIFGFVILVDNADNNGVVIDKWYDASPVPTREQLKQYTVAECVDTFNLFMKIIEPDFTYTNTKSIDYYGCWDETKSTIVSYTYVNKKAVIAFPAFKVFGDNTNSERILAIEESIPKLILPTKNISFNISIYDGEILKLGTIQLKRNGSIIICAGLDEERFSITNKIVGYSEFTIQYDC